jgi:PAS domain S-box-containing protein
LLRQEAEAVVGRNAAPSPENLGALAPEEILKFVNELRVHQVEVEMQNEELRLTLGKLDASQARYFDFYDLAPVGYCSLDENGLILQANRTTARLLGVARNKLLERSITRFIFSEDKDIYYLFRRRLSAAGGMHACDLRMVKRDGTQSWVRMDAISVPESDGSQIVRLVLSDITKRKLAEIALQTSEEFNVAILNSLSSQVAVLDLEGVIVATNEAWRRFALENSARPGQPATNTQVGGNYLDICQASQGDSTAGATEARDGILAVLGNRLPTFSLEYPCHSPAERRWFTMTVTPLDMGSRGVVIVHTNITERKQSAMALQVSEQKYRALLEHAADAVVISDMAGTVLEINAAAKTLLGYDRNELIGEHIRMIHPVEEVPLVAAAFARFADADRVDTGTCHVLTKQGQHVPVQVNAMAIVVGEHKVVMGIFRDLSEQQKLEAQRLRDEAAHRDALVREVHHRIKNSLQGVTGILRGLAQRQPALAAALDDVVGQVGSIALVHGLYGNAPGRRVALCDLLADVTRNAESLWQMQISVKVEHNCPHCILDEREAVPLALVLNELLANACKHGGGKSAIDKPTVAVEYATDYSQARVRITNPGQLPPGFDFGKRLGLGTGLGLVAVLLPRESASLDWTQQQDTVVTLLSLSAPIFAEQAIAEGSSA